MKDLDALVSEANDLEALPDSIMRLTSLLADDDWIIGDIVQTVVYDEVLTGKLLQWANSPVGGSMERIDSVGDAIARMGPGHLLSLAFASAVGDGMQRPLRTYGLEADVLWRHSVAAAVAVDLAGDYCGLTPPPEGFVAALLHDIGKLIVDRHAQELPDEEQIETPPDSETGSLELESQLLGADHAVLGGLVTAQWNLSEEITQAIAFHHEPDEAPDAASRSLASFVGLADFVAHRIGAGCGPGQPSLSRGSVRRLCLTREGLEALCAATSERLEGVMKLYS